MKLQDLINEEAYHEKLYEALSKVAPNEDAKNILIDLEKEEKKHGLFHKMKI